MRPAEGRRRFGLVQGLRALAAGAVAFDHVAHDLVAAMPGAALLAVLWHAMPWRAGVDVFFVISGFVIVHASGPLFGRRSGPARFLGRRLTRIVPLYWAATTLVLATLSLDRTLLHGSVGGIGYVVRSYLFIPAARPDGLVQPVLGLGWTLDFEMLFYVCFAPCVWLGRAGAVAAICAGFGCLVAAGRLGLLSGTAPTTWADPIVLEFCAGTLLALAADRVRLGRAVRAALVAVALAALAAAPDGVARVVGFGGPAVLLVAAATLKRPSRNDDRALLQRLGDASYATYLLHPFVMRPASVLLAHAGRHRPPALLAAALVLVLVQAVAIAVHERLERPLLERLRAGLTLRVRADRASATDPRSGRPAPPAPHAAGTASPRRARHARGRFRR